MEATWLVAVIVVPVFFNILSSRIFEPDKLTLLRSLALLALAAWVVKLLSEGGSKWENIERGDAWYRTLLRIPIVWPILFLAFVYIIATVFSVTPYTSFWGSYQRLQGTYTTFSYLILFSVIAANLRRREQVERLVTTVIVCSLPVSLYGILQRYGIDPVPWGGDVTRRIAANMGNSIFLAAYLIMVFPLVVVRALESFRAILNDKGRLAPNFALSTAYVFIGVLMLVAIYFTGSRGPWLGLLAGTFFLMVVFSLLWRKRWLTITVIVAAVLVAGFLGSLNIEDGPLEGLRDRPELTRLAHLLDAESRTGRVRTLIWQGASELVLPHEPIEFPDGRTDLWNTLRPLVGYGPEGMYVAFNRFYPPELTQVEKRNASPDRSHNETWDALVMRGVLGLAAYIALFTTIFYYGLKWLGLIQGSKQRNLFYGLYFGGGFVVTLGLALSFGVPYLGVGIPFGLVVGLFLYIILVALFSEYEAPETEGQRVRALALLGLLAVIVSHFVEINFGISIAATRTYLFAFAALLLVVGHVMPLYGEYEKAPEPGISVGEEEPPRKLKRRTSRRRSATSRTIPVWAYKTIASAFIVGVLVTTLGFNYITNVRGGDTAVDILLNSLVRLGGSGSSSSYGMLAMVLISWFVACLVLASENALYEETTDWLKVLGGILGLSLLIASVFWLWHSSSLAALANVRAGTVQDVINLISRYEGLLARYYIYLLLLILGAAFVLPPRWLAGATRTGWVDFILAPVALITVLVVASYTNLRVIQADISFKLAEPFTREGNQWPVALAIYERANEMAPNEDYYYLFLGRAYLEYARTLEDPSEREQLVRAAERDLLKAQQINPLNTDHTANLARLYSLWALYSQEPAEREELAASSAEYFDRAVTLSPNNARLWDEWGVVYMNQLDQPEEALQRFTHARDLDPRYDWTYGLLGDLYSRIAATSEDPEEVEKALYNAAENYRTALDVTPTQDATTKAQYIQALGAVLAQLGEMEAAAEAYELLLEMNPNRSDAWRIEETIARLYAQIDDVGAALYHAQRALTLAPEDQKPRVQTLIDQLNSP